MKPSSMDQRIPCPTHCVNLLLSCTVVAMLVATGCGAPDTSSPEGEEAKLETYDMRGEIVRLIPADKIAVIKHEDIKGWMKAMTMEFLVKDEAEFKKLKEGDRIEAKVYVQDLDFWIGDIRVVSQEASPSPN